MLLGILGCARQPLLVFETAETDKKAAKGGGAASDLSSSGGGRGGGRGVGGERKGCLLN